MENAKAIMNVQTVAPALITHVLIHASVNVVRTQFVKLNDTLQFANVPEDMTATLPHHVFDNHEHTIHILDTIRKSEQPQN